MVNFSDVKDGELNTTIIYDVLLLRNMEYRLMFWCDLIPYHIQRKHSALTGPCNHVQKNLGASNTHVLNLMKHQNFEIFVNMSRVTKIVILALIFSSLLLLNLGLVPHIYVAETSSFPPWSLYAKQFHIFYSQCQAKISWLYPRYIMGWTNLKQGTF